MWGPGTTESSGMAVEPHGGSASLSLCPREPNLPPEVFTWVSTPAFLAPRNHPPTRLSLLHRLAGLCLVPQTPCVHWDSTDQVMRLRPREARQLGQKQDNPPGVWNRPNPNSIHLEHPPCHPRIQCHGFAGQPGHTASSPQQAGLRNPQQVSQDPPVPRLTHPCSSASRGPRTQDTCASCQAINAKDREYAN